MEVEASRTVELQSVVEPSVWLLMLCWRPLKLLRDTVVLEASLTELPVRCKQPDVTASTLTKEEGSWLGLLGRCTSMAAVVMTRAGSGIPISVRTTQNVKGVETLRHCVGCRKERSRILLLTTAWLTVVLADVVVHVILTMVI